MVPVRPLLRWHGGKWKLAPWIIENLPPHRVYVEPFGGAASVLLRKPRSYGEVYNDLDDDVVGLFRTLRDPAASDRLIRSLNLTPFSRAEFRESYEDSDDKVEQSRRLIVRSFMGFGSNAHASDANGHRSTSFRSNSNRSGTTPAQDWARYPECLALIVERLRGVVIENRNALTVMLQHDGSQTCHYLDPPYVHSTRAPAGKVDCDHRMYRHEMSDDEHVELLEAAKRIKGMVVISGYATTLYDQALRGWHRIERKTFADGARERREILWINPAAREAMHERQDDLPFKGVA